MRFHADNHAAIAASMTWSGRSPRPSPAEPVPLGSDPVAIPLRISLANDQRTFRSPPTNQLIKVLDPATAGHVSLATPTVRGDDMDDARGEARVAVPLDDASLREAPVSEFTLRAFVGTATAIAILTGGLSPSWATFMIDPNPDGGSFFFIDAVKNK